MMFSFSEVVLAQSVAQAGKQCSGEVAVSSLSCVNPDGGDDPRLYITEFQECKDGVISQLDKTIHGFVFSEPLDSDSADVKVVFSGVRTHFDDRVNDLTMDLPKSAVIKTKHSTVQMEISTELEADYEGADINSAWHYKGSYKLVTTSGAVSAGRLACFITN